MRKAAPTSQASILRKSILQAAVQGKLVPQNASDEPANVLLECIQAEKFKLVKEGKLKKEKPLPPITEDEKPFALPDEWEWVRLGKLAYNIHYGFTASASDKGEARLLRITDIQNDSVDWEKVPYCTIKPHELANFELGLRDILIARTGGTIGKSYIINEIFGKSVFASYLIRIIPSIFINEKYLKVFLSCPLYWEQLHEKSMGTGQPNVNASSLKSLMLPIPPLAEQERIVAKVNELMLQCDQLEQAEQAALALDKHFFETLPKSILQAAVQGKLVPQDENDEPASGLIKRIQAEKAKLVKDGKLKKEKPLPPITEEEKPFDLPKGWEWVRLGDIIQLLSGRDLEPSAYNDLDKGIPYITGASAIINSKIEVTRWTDNPIVVSENDDILITCKGTVGKVVINDIGDCHIARQIMAIRIIGEELDKYFLSNILRSVTPRLTTQAKSMIPGISREDILELICAIPPLLEQKRIVTKLEKLMQIVRR